MLITISLKIFVFFKSHMGTPLDWNFFTLKKKSHFHLLLGQTRAQKKSSSELDTRYLIPKCFSPWSFLTHIKNPMGLEGFFLNGVFACRTEKSCLNRSSTKFSKWKSIKTCTKILHNVSNDLTEIFWCQKSCGNTTRLRFFPETNFLESI